MKERSCKTCSLYSKCEDSFASWIYFFIGIVAAIAIRLVTFLIDLGVFYAKASWYIGVAGFIIFFVYKFRILQERSKQISKQNIVEKIDRKWSLTNEDYLLIKTILCSLSSKKERINYFFIFGLSAVALVIAIYFDFFA
ncbi:MAG: hypothetical protein KKH98_12660 [Spirochaetes bacterium]|nr:hypothetical protein [Spirochaetota bacterium]